MRLVTAINGDTIEPSLPTGRALNLSSKPT